MLFFLFFGVEERTGFQIEFGQGLVFWGVSRSEVSAMFLMANELTGLWRTYKRVRMVRQKLQVAYNQKWYLLDILSMCHSEILNHTPR